MMDDRTFKIIILFDIVIIMILIYILSITIN
jgi:hypothetical protein